MEFSQGTKIQKYLKWLEKTQWWRHKELEELQNKKLRALIKHAYENVPYYHQLLRGLNLKSDDIKTVEDLQKLPILTKAEIRRNFSDMLAKDPEKWMPRLNATSGSTGEPLRYYITKDNLSIGWASGFRAWGWAGYALGDKRATLAGTSLIPKESPELNKRVRWFLERNLPLSAVDMNGEKIAAYVKMLRQYKPKFVRGYPSALYIFANFLKKEGISDIKPKAVFTTAEMLLQPYRELIEEQFGCEVFDGYGCRDGGANAMECSEHRYHISIEQVVMEFVKADEQVSSGEPGEIIATDLHNYAMPFIRYAVGDVGTPLDERCSCGRNLPLMKSIEGRTTDIIIFGNGVMLSGPALTLVFKDRNIEQYQVIQESKNELIIKIVKGSNYTENDTNHILKIIKGHVGEEVDIKIEFVNNIQTTKTGKHRFIISKVPSNFECLR